DHGLEQHVGLVRELGRDPPGRGLVEALLLEHVGDLCLGLAGAVRDLLTFLLDLERKISRWLFELMYSPAPIEMISASAAAMPATSTGNCWLVAVATVMTTMRMLVTPSCAPKIASRTSLSRSASRRSRSEEHTSELQSRFDL